MRTSISFNLTKDEAVRTKTMAEKRGFDTTSDYLRFLISQDDTDLIGEDELVKRTGEIEKLYKAGKLIRAKSMADLLA